MRKTLFPLLLLGFSLNANAWQTLSNPNGVTINQNAGERSKTFQVILKNDSAAKASFAPQLPSVSSYKVALDRCKNVAPQAVCSITMSFSPKLNVANEGSLAGASGGIVALSSTVSPKDVQPEERTASISPDSMELTFEEGQRSKLLDFTVTNTGNTAMLLDISTQDASVSINRCKSSLAPGKSCMVYLSVKNVQAQAYLFVENAGELLTESNIVVNASGTPVPTPTPLPPIAYQWFWAPPVNPNLPACSAPQAVPYGVPAPGNPTIRLPSCRTVVTQQTVSNINCPVNPQSIPPRPAPVVFSPAEACTDVTVSIDSYEIYSIMFQRNGYRVHGSFSEPVSLTQDADISSFVTTVNANASDMVIEPDGMTFAFNLAPAMDDINNPISVKITEGLVTNGDKLNNESDTFEIQSRTFRFGPVPSDTRIEGMSFEGGSFTVDMNNSNFNIILFPHDEFYFTWYTASSGKQFSQFSWDSSSDINEHVGNYNSDDASFSINGVELQGVTDEEVTLTVEAN